MVGVILLIFFIGALGTTVMFADTWTFKGVEGDDWIGEFAAAAAIFFVFGVFGVFVVFVVFVVIVIF